MSTRLPLRSLLLVASLTLGACAGRTLDVGDGETSAPQGSEAASALAACNNPAHGPVELLSAKTDTETKVARRWFACPNPNGEKSKVWVEDLAGIELTADGQWFHLAQNASGTLVRQLGAEHQGTWDVAEPIANLPPTQVTIRDSGAGFIPSQVVFETAPARMKVQSHVPEYPNGWFVALAKVEPKERRD